MLQIPYFSFLGKRELYTRRVFNVLTKKTAIFSNLPLLSKLLVKPPVCYRHWAYPTLFVVGFGQKRMYLFWAPPPWSWLIWFWPRSSSFDVSCLSLAPCPSGPGMSIFLKPFILWSLVLVLCMLQDKIVLRPLYSLTTLPYLNPKLWALPLSSKCRHFSLGCLSITNCHGTLTTLHEHISCLCPTLANHAATSWGIFFLSNRMECWLWVMFCE